MIVDWSDAMTVLQARENKRLAKMLTKKGKFLDYDSAYFYDGYVISVDGLDSLMRALRLLIGKPDRCVVRGRLIAGDKAARIRRLAYRDKQTGDGSTLLEVPRRWLALDADGIERPNSIAAIDLEACAEVVLDCLPAVFQQTACIVQASAGHGIKPGCRLRLWFWCDRPMAGRELMQWLRDTPLDRSVFRTVQPIYTAAPVFADGCAEHLPKRLCFLDGREWLRCPSAEALAPPAAKPRPADEAIAFGSQADAYSRAALVRAADAVATAPEGRRHDTLISEARGLSRLVRVGLLTERDLRAILTRAAEQAGKTSAVEVVSAIAWGLANPSDGTLPEARDAA